MIRLAICDDDTIAVEQIERAVQDFNASHREWQAIHTEKYVSSQLLCDDVTDGKIFDAFLLDVEMPEMDGFQLADRLRLQLPAAAVIFLTSHIEPHLIQESFKVGTLRYVNKLDMGRALPEALEAAVALCRKTAGSYLTVTHYTDAVRIPLDEIIFVHKVARSLEIVTERQGKLKDNRGLKDLLAALNDERFLLIDRSCFVNLDFITQIAESDLILKTGERLAVSRKLLPQVKAAIVRLWGGVG